MVIFILAQLNGHKQIGVDLVPKDVIDDAVSDLRRADYDYIEYEETNHDEHYLRLN